jgi:hypothetical protein
MALLKRVKQMEMASCFIKIKHFIRVNLLMDALQGMES